MQQRFISSPGIDCPAFFYLVAIPSETCDTWSPGPEKGEMEAAL